MITPPQHLPVAVIGGGQAGLAISWYLKQRGIEHRVFERHGVAHEWRNARWDSFCLVTPNWQCRLPGFSYDKEFGGKDPKGFMLKDDIVRYLEAYVASFDPPLSTGVDVQRVRAADNGGFEIKTSKGDYVADQVVVAIGGYHLPTIPRSAEKLPADILQLHSSNYRHPAQLPDGGVLVVGTGQSGCQIAEDLHREGREVHLAVGTAPRSPRVYRGREVTEWLTESGYYGIAIADHPQKETVREKTNHYLSGRDGGKEIDLRQFAREGMKLYGRFSDIRDGCVRFEPDLRRNLDRADDSYRSIRAAVDSHIAAQGIDAPVEPPYQPCWQPDAEIDMLDLRAAGIGSVIWSIGFAADYRWLEAPVFDGRGQVVHQRGVSPVEGLYFLGLPWQNTWGSGRFADVGFDAAFLAERITAAKVAV
ncbi:MSMEG_0569 family flavin-dependent oxidoreductase [Hydrocarboniphaga sp.]|uniref:MSMEG_0569 family flavin-dependent oxidoreductase n=1 Tax=Hydrocarboniphaga sp. TaxID=2033016 RepID=UPI003D11981C